ncbi:response regulator [Thermodesulfobacteriota bacterium]
MGKAEDNPVLIIEDDKHTASLVELYLKREGFRALKAEDGETGLAMAEEHQPVMIILDLMLPKMDGWEVCRRLRRKSDVPVIMLTARGEEIDRVSGLTLGADDYLVKPFSPRELMARVKAVLRRASSKDTSPESVLIYSGIELDLEKRRLSINNQTVSLTPHEFALLKTLMSAPGRVYTRDELLDRIYPRGEALVIERVVDVHIGKLRQKMEPDSSKPRYILTARGVGYRFAD